MSVPPRVLVVEHEGDTGAGLFGARLRVQGLRLDVARMHAGEPLPPDLDGYAGLLVLGGTPDPDQDDVAPWLAGTCALIGEALARRTPFFGICLGAQLLARASGGRTGDLAGGPEIGLHEVQRTPAADDDALFAAVPAAAPAVQWHWVEVAELPPGAVALATSQRCANQAFRVGPLAWGVQFHLEAATETVRDWSGSDPARLEALGLDGEQLTREVAAADSRLREVWEPFADRWAAVVLGGTAGAPRR